MQAHTGRACIDISLLLVSNSLIHLISTLLEFTLDPIVLPTQSPDQSPLDIDPQTENEQWLQARLQSYVEQAKTRC